MGEAVSIGFTPVRLESVVQPTSIRTDKSGSKSSADETVFLGRILIAPDVVPSEDDIIDLYGKQYRIESVFPRYELQGMLHHYQVDLIKWQKD